MGKRLSLNLDILASPDSESSHIPSLLQVVENAIGTEDKVHRPFWRHALLTVTIAATITGVSMVTDCVGIVMELNVSNVSQYILSKNNYHLGK